MKVLIADDDPTTCTMLEGMTMELGLHPVIVFDGQEAWNILQAEDAPPIALLDWEMPGIDGIEICRRLRQQNKFIHAILVTSRKSHKDIIEGLQAGADDYLAKPPDHEELKARISVGQRLIGLQGDLKNRLREIEETMLSIQQSFLLGPIPEGLEGVSIFARIIPYSEIAGDFYDFHDHSSRIFDLVTGDVMGKGIKPALLAAATTYQLLRHLRELLITAPEEFPPSIVRVLTETVTHLVPKFRDRESFVTLFFGRFNLDKQLLTYSNYGHQPPLYYSRRTGRITSIEATNSALGLEIDQKPEVANLPFESGDVFLFTSDGINEIRNADGRFFGKEVIRPLFEANIDVPPEPLATLILDAARKYSAQNRFFDDATCVVVRIT